MHPIAARPRHLVAYLAGWVPLSLLAGLTLVPAGDAAWAHLVFALALGMVYAFACLAPGYARRTVHGLGALVTQLVAAGAASVMLLAVARISAEALAFSPSLQSLPHTLSSRGPEMVTVAFLLYLLSAAFHQMLFAQEDGAAAERESARLGLLARDAQVASLKAQLNPHFLFNSLNSVSALVHEDPDRAQEVITGLSELLRSSLRLGQTDRVPLSEELGLARSYLEIERVRFAGRLDFELSVGPGCASVPIPALLLQPLVENAVTHGVGQRIEGGTVGLAAALENDALVLLVTNPTDPAGSGQPGTGLGLRSVRQRLDAEYAGAARFEAREDEGMYRARIRIPLEEA